MTEKVGRLDVHLKLISKTSDRRKCSRSALPEVNVDKKVAGGKGSTNNYRYLPTSAGKKSTAMLIKPRTRFGVNVRKHNEPHRLSNQKNLVYQAEIGD